MEKNNTPQNRFSSVSYGGYRIEYPTLEEVNGFERDLSWDERFEVLHQGYKRGCYIEQCYSIRELATRVAERNPYDPTGGVRFLEGEKLVEWIRDVVGDRDLATTIEKIYAAEESMAVIVDTVRVVLMARMNQYSEVLEEADVD